MKLGFLLDNLGPSQLAYSVIRGVNEYLEKGGDVPVVLFYERLLPFCLTPHTASMQLAEAWTFDGLLVATSFRTAEKLINLPAARLRSHFFWCYDLEWVRFANKAYRPLADVYRSPRLRLLGRGPDHKAALETAWNVPVGTMEELDIEYLLREGVAQPP
jgi:hypothetical protein